MFYFLTHPITNCNNLPTKICWENVITILFTSISLNLILILQASKEVLYWVGPWVRRTWVHPAQPSQSYRPFYWPLTLWKCQLSRRIFFLSRSTLWVLHADTAFYKFFFFGMLIPFIGQLLYSLNALSLCALLADSFESDVLCSVVYTTTANNS